MHDNIVVVHQDPISDAIAFYLARPITGYSKGLTDAVSHGLYLIGIGTACDHKIVCNNRYPSNVNDTNIIGFLVFQCSNCKFGHFFRLIHAYLH